MTPLKTNILIADDHPIVLKGLRTVLNAQPDLEVVAEATDGEQAVERALAEPVHLAILDISMPRKTGLQAAREITQRKPEVRVLMLSMHDNEQFLFEAIRAGASGYVLKSSVDRDLVEACRATMRGQPFLYPGGVQALMREYLERARTGEAIHGERTSDGRPYSSASIVLTQRSLSEVISSTARSNSSPSNPLPMYICRTSSRSPSGASSMCRYSIFSMRR